MRNILAIVLILVGITSYGQADLRVTTNEILQVSDLENILRAVNYNQFNSPEDNEIAGSPYLHEAFSSGTVTLQNEKTFKNIPLRYNVYNDQIEIKGKNDVIFNLNPSAKISEIKIESATFINLTKPNEDAESNNWMEILAEGRLTLLKKYRVSISPAKKAETHRDAQPATFVMQPPQYFIKLENGLVTRIKNKKELQRITSDKTLSTDKYIKGNILSSNTESELIQFISAYNSF